MRTLLLAVVLFPHVLQADWPQWRGPKRDGFVSESVWPDRLNEQNFQQKWRVPLGSSYSGPVVSEKLVFTTESKGDSEAAIALDRKTGQQVWRTEWKGSMTVPFFAASNGSWIRATPAYDGDSLYVAGMRDVLLCLNAADGKEKWKVDFVKEFKSELPAFGYVSSPLVDGEHVYVQAGGGAVKLDKKTGKVIWRTLKDDGGMMGSAFSSPVIAELAGQRQLIVQTREILAGVELEKGDVLWSQKIPSFRGMNILTPIVLKDTLFTSTYQNKSWLYKVEKSGSTFGIKEQWTANVQGYMSTPVVIDNHAYLHLQNQRFACINLATGEKTWNTDTAFGKYWSLVANKGRILALDQKGILYLIQASAKEYQQIDKLKVSKSETWAHLAVSGDEVFIRELDGLACYRWK